MCDGNDGNSSKSITFTRTCVPYYIHVRKKFKKSGVIPVIRVTDLQGFSHGVTINNVKPVIQQIWKFLQLIQMRISCIRGAYTAVL